MTLLTQVPEDVAARIAAVIDKAQLCIRLTTNEDGGRNTRFDHRGMNLWEVWAVCEEIAMACRLRRMVGWKDPREELDTLGVDQEAKVCATYTPGDQNFTWMRKSLSYMDTALACMTTARICQQLLFPPESVT